MKPNILLIVIDSARPDGFSCYGNERETTPNIDALAEDGLVFDNVFSAGGWTPPSHAAFFSGKLPSETGSLTPEPVLEADGTLASSLKDAGYHTLGIATSSHIIPSAGYDRGFDEYIIPYRDYSRYSFNLDMAFDTLKDRIWGRNDRTHFTTELLKKKLSSSEKPFFAFVNLATAHRKYGAPRRIWKRFARDEGRDDILNYLNEASENDIEEAMVSGELQPTEEEFDTMKSWHHASLHRADEYVGRILEFLEENGILDDTVVVITSDHGDEFGEHDRFMHGYLYDTCLHVPLIVRGPGVPEGRYEGLTSLTDLVPTLIELGGGKVPEGLEGVPIFPLESHVRERVLAERGETGEDYSDPELARRKGAAKAVRTENYKLIRRRNFGDELYDMEDDPEEMDNIIDGHPEVAEELAEHLPEFGEAEEGEEFHGTDDPAVERRLKELGYL